jgi:uncharacterized protein YbaR (Trm112 family)
MSLVIPRNFNRAPEPPKQEQQCPRCDQKIVYVNHSDFHGIVICPLCAERWFFVPGIPQLFNPRNVTMDDETQTIEIKL